MDIKIFNEKLSSSAPTPGGGAVSALISTIAISLSLMVSNLTIGKPKYKEYDDEINEIIKKAEKSKAIFYELINKDEEVYLELSKVYKIPKEEPNRNKILEEALINAASIPLQLLTEINDIVFVVKDLLLKGNKMAKSDVAISASLFKSAAESSLINVYINTKSMKDINKAHELNKEAEEITTEIINITKNVYNEIKKELI